ncbi:MAG: CDP-glucose 4,6-dehydratase [Butyrivibrio sp.]|uniref:CDP-glucose 4,6-dehydratase n=1 Tax=Butyrivibrio sp. TaxID=28121 RepID=UPI001B23C0E1|nr:CDP-glucose 4,6-dehydratase [Butyrivibrio sp.]MBO6239851.1 CDP-glucose 4,6-dehydratase [Butyrivibrio sp.]
MLDFYKGKRVLITGHTGFKGSWLTKILSLAGAQVYGYSLPPEGDENLFDISKVDESIESFFGDIRDYDSLKKFFDEAKPEIVFHLAAQPLVRDSYERPRYTYETNVMGTVNVCECVRMSGTVKSFLNITTDKVYQNNEWEWGYREDEKLDGYDPYSNSKSCSELVTHSYINSFFGDLQIATSTARAGNVIGGGDFAKDRIVPDLVRACRSGQKITLRNPDSTRPYQHVLEALSAYLLIAEKQYEDPKFAGFYNVGPNDADAVTTIKIARLFREKYGEPEIEIKPDGGPHEANYLKLDCSKIKSKLGWVPKWDINMAIEKTVEWTKGYLEGRAVEIMEKEIKEHFDD